MCDVSPADALPRANDDVRTPSRALPIDVLSHLGANLREAFALPDTLPAHCAALIDEIERVFSAGLSAAAAQQLKRALIDAMPALRGFAYSLTRNADRSDDLVQDTLVRAWAKADTFTAGTNLTAWLFTIMRNLFYSEQRKRKREVEDADGIRAGRLIALPEQPAHLDLKDFRTALGILTETQQEALMLIGAHGLSYEEAADVCGVAVGTVKSRVNRARTRLVELLGMTGTDDIGADAVTRATFAQVP